MRRFGNRSVATGLVAAVLALGGVFGVLAASSSATSPPAKPAALPHTLGFVGAVSASVRLPIGKQLVIQPYGFYVVQRPALAQVLRALASRRLGSWHRRMVVRFTTRIATTASRPRPKAHTLVVLTRTLTGQALIASAVRSAMGVRFRLGRFVLSPALTARIKQALKKSPKLEISSSVSYSVRFTARGRAVTLAGTPWSFSWTQHFTAPRSGGANLHQLDLAMRKVIGLVQSSPMACQTRNTLVRRLRLTDTVIVSGQRSGAATLLGAWIASARSMRAAGVVSAQQEAMLRVRLSAIQRRVGVGWPTRHFRPRLWPALPNCNGASAAASGYTVWDPSDIKTVLDFIVGNIPGVGKFLGPLLSIFWPNDTVDYSTMLTLAVNQGVYDLVGGDLNGVKGSVDDFLNTESQLGYNGFTPDYVAGDWYRKRDDIRNDVGQFYSPNREWALLPLYAQYENMYLSFIREGVLSGMKWGWSPNFLVSMYQTYFLGGDGLKSHGSTGINDALPYVKTIHDHQIRTDLGCKYPDSTTDPPDNTGCATDPKTVFTKTNPDERKFQLLTGDYGPMWKFLDPMAYPFGDPNFKVTRMIYSDLVGNVKSSTFSVPTNQSYPLSSITACDKYIPLTSYWYFDAIKADNSPLTGVFTGDTTTTCHTPKNGNAYTATWPGGPIIDAKGYRVANSNVNTIARIDVTYSNGTGHHLGPSTSSVTLPQDFTYPDETLQAVKIIGAWSPGASEYVGDSAVFGFRYTNSFDPSGEVRLSAGNCLDLPSPSSPAGTQAVLKTCGTTPTLTQDWTYNSATHQLSTSGGWLCLQARDGGTSVGTPVEIYQSSQPGLFGNTLACSEATFNSTSTAQQWTVNSDGTVVNVKSGLCLSPANNSTTDGTGLVLNTCSGTATQHWTSPWTKPLPGAIHAPGTDNGQCLQAAPPPQEIPLAPYPADNYNTALEMMGCGEHQANDQWPVEWQQHWYYDQYTGLGGTRATFALQLFGGTKCMSGSTAPTTSVTIQTCDATSDLQKWTKNDDGTIRPATASQLCLTRKDGQASDGTPIELSLCSAGNVAQQWVSPVG